MSAFGMPANPALLAQRKLFGQPGAPPVDNTGNPDIGFQSRPDPLQTGMPSVQAPTASPAQDALFGNAPKDAAQPTAAAAKPPMSEQDYSQANPDAYKAYMPPRPLRDIDYSAHPGINRALRALFAGMAEFGRPGEGAAMVDRWYGQDAAQRQYDNPANQERMQAGALNQAYQNYLQHGQEAANIPHTVAETQNLGAQTSAIATRQALEQAQTEAAYFKEDPNVGLIDVRTGKAVSAAGLVPLTKQEADVLGKQEGDRVPLKLKDTANQIVQRGVKLASANGQEMLIDGQGHVIKTLGKATPTMNVQLSHDLQSQNQAVDEVRKNYATAQDADERLSRMEASYKQAAQGNQQAMLALLSDHIGMTMGLQKGARITKDIINEAAQSAPWLSRIAAKFDSNGYLSGVTLTPEQMRQMLELGYGARDRAWTRAFQASELNGTPEPPGARAIYAKRKEGEMPALQENAGGGQATGKTAPAGATHIGIGSQDKKKHYLDANGNDLGLAE